MSYLSERMVALLVKDGKFLTRRSGKAPWVVLEGGLFRLYDRDAYGYHGCFDTFCAKRRKRGIMLPWHRP